jgi:hypothetical protein
MGGVCAAGCGGASGAFAVVDVCDAAVRDAKTKTAEESNTTLRMVVLSKNDFSKNCMPVTWVSENAGRLFAVDTGAGGRSVYVRSCNEAGKKCIGVTP